MRFPSVTPSHAKSDQRARFWRSRYGLGLTVIGAVVSYFLLTEHLTHTLAALPYLLLLACPLMHLFMHHEHGGNDHPAKPDDAP